MGLHGFQGRASRPPLTARFIGTHNETLTVTMRVNNPDGAPLGINGWVPSGSIQVRGEDAASAASASGKIWNTSSRRELFKTSRTVSCNPASKNFPP